MARSTASIRELTGVTIVDFSGVLMLGESAALFRKTIGELLGSGRTRIILNFRGLTTVDSAGVGELVAAYALMKSKEVSLKLLNPPHNVQGVLKLTNLANLFDVYADEILALHSFDQP